MSDNESPHILEVAKRVNPSLVSSGLSHVVRRAEGRSGGAWRLRLGGYSEALHVVGSVRSASPPLDWNRLALLSQPVWAQVVMEEEGGSSCTKEVELLPLSAFSLRARHARATAAFVMEASPTVHHLVNNSGAHRSGDRPPRDRATRARLAFAALVRADLRYHFELAMFGEDEQAVRFPGQIVGDGGYGGGTCLDIALLYAGMLQLLDCDPVILMLGEEFGSRHVIVGMAVEGTDSVDPVLPGQRVQASVRDGAIVPVEVSAVSRPGAVFEEAVDEGRRAVNDRSVLWGVDIGVARRSGIHSVPVEPIFQSSLRSEDQATELLTVEAVEALSSYRLVVVDSLVDADRARSWDLSEVARARVRIGRGGENDADLSDVMLSRLHAALSFHDDQVRLVDLGSLYGTFCRGRRLDPFAPLAITGEDVFSLGPSDNVRLRIEQRSP